jgi:hypothetical protein
MNVLRLKLIPPINEPPAMINNNTHGFNPLLLINSFRSTYNKMRIRTIANITPYMISIENFGLISSI